METAAKKQENPFANLLFNIVIPVVILNQLSKRLGEDGPTIALIVALAFPIGYGLSDYLKNRRKNLLSILGILNTLFTGGLALMSLEGIWFAVKEAAFPLVMGLAVLYSAYTQKPVIRFLIFDSGMMDEKRITDILAERQQQGPFAQQLKKSTLLLAVSFFLSSLLNFVLARYIFTDINISLPALERASQLNDQIAQMTWLSFLVIAMPLMVFMMFIMWDLFKGLKQLTGLELTEILPNAKT